MRIGLGTAPAILLAAAAFGLIVTADDGRAVPSQRATAPNVVIEVVDTSNMPPQPKLPTSNIPKQQGKAVKGEEKSFADGKLKITLSEITPQAVKGKINGGDDIELNGGSSKKFLVGDLACEVTYLGPSGDRAILMGGCAPATDEDKAKIAAAKTAENTSKPPKDVVAAAQEGTLKNPYTGDADAIEQGHKLFLASGCNGCHGGNGGGGMCPPLTNDTFVYGDADDILFRLITNGSEGLLKTGHTRIGRENVVGPMPPFGDIVHSDQDLWKIIAFIRSVYAGDPARAKDWQK